MGLRSGGGAYHPHGRTRRAEEKPAYNSTAVRCGRPTSSSINGVPVMNPARITLETTTLGNTEASLCVANYMLHVGADHS